MAAAPFVRRLRLRNYKSISVCDVELGQLTLLVGRNGSGKSNFLDGLRFVADGLNLSLDHAIKSRGGIDAVRRRSTGHPHNFGIDLELQVSDDEFANYGFEIAAQPLGGLRVKYERLTIHRGGGQVVAGFQIVDGQLQRDAALPLLGGGNGHGRESMPPVLADRLYLVHAAGLPLFRTAYDGLRSMAFYHFDPQRIRELQPMDAGDVLAIDGSNAASVLARLKRDNPGIVARVESYLSAVIPDITGVDVSETSAYGFIEFSQRVEGANLPWRFPARLISDGTLIALGVLLAANQETANSRRVRLVGIEEPEAALHPAAAGTLMDALREAAVETQIIVTTHSPDLLERVDPDFEKLLVLQAAQGRTSVAPVDAASRETIRNHLYTAGELLRMDQLEPDPADVERQAQLPFFAEVEAAS